jgi:uncharacterized protein YgfB (UPF0149 family)
VSDVELPSWNAVADAIAGMALGTSPAELHGALTGWFAGGGADAPDWLGRVMADDALPQVPAGTPLDTLRAASLAQLSDRGFGFELLLPEGDATLGERSGALFDWCRGFLGAFGLATGANPPLSEEGSEALTDLANLATATAQDDGDEDDEEALARSRNSFASRSCCCTATACWRPAIAAVQLRWRRPRSSRGPCRCRCRRTRGRRKQLMRMAGDDAILVLPSAPERIRSRDTHYPYRQDSDFWYLTGFAEPEAVLVLVPGRPHGEALLFCRERDPDREAWDGPRAGQEGAVDASAWTMRTHRGPGRDPARAAGRAARACTTTSVATRSSTSSSSAG